MSAIGNAQLSGALSSRTRSIPRDAIAIAVWITLVLVAAVWGRALALAQPEIRLDAAPLFGRVDPELSPRLLVPVLVAIALIWAAPLLVRRIAWKSLLIAALVGGGAWVFSLAFAVGPGAWHTPLSNPSDYLGSVNTVGSLPAFLSTFVERLPEYPIHVQGHPPGMVSFLWALEAIGLGGARWAAIFTIAGGVSAIAAVLISVKAVAGEDRARAAAPFIALAPAAIWIATSADGLFMGVGAWAVAFALLASTRTGASSVVLAVSGGVLFGVALLLSYGLVLIGVITATALVAKRRTDLLLPYMAGATIVLGLSAVAGFWWVEGFFDTRERYLAGVAADRPVAFFLLSNLAALALVLGPAIVVGIGRLDGRMWWLVGAGLAVVAVANASGMSKGEVERIWLPFAVWILPAAAALPTPRCRGWLAVQVALAVLIEVLVVTPW